MDDREELAKSIAGKDLFEVNPEIKIKTLNKVLHTICINI